MKGPTSLSYLALHLGQQQLRAFGGSHRRSAPLRLWATSFADSGMAFVHLGDIDGKAGDPTLADASVLGSWFSRKAPSAAMFIARPLTGGHPYRTARLIATMDHASRGRVGWSPITSADGDALPSEQVAEYLELVALLQDSCAADSTDTGEIDFHGTYYRLRGSRVTVRSRQGMPPLAVAAGTRGADDARVEVTFVAEHENDPATPTAGCRYVRVECTTTLDGRLVAASDGVDLLERVHELTAVEGTAGVLLAPSDVGLRTLAALYEDFLPRAFALPKIIRPTGSTLRSRL